METFKDILVFLDAPLITLGQSSVTIWNLLVAVSVLVLLGTLTAKLNRLIIYRLMSKSDIQLGVRVAVASLVRYVVLVIALIVVLQFMGIDMTSLALLFGALGVGIGFGLQNITNNFVSGLIILLERPIKVGDRIEMGGVSGDVTNISMRATTIRTNDNISMIVPNSDFITSTVINWSHTDRNVRFNFPVAVSYKEDPERVRGLLLEVARENKGVLVTPPPDVLFKEYADSAIVLNLRVWTRDYIDRPGVLKSQLYYAIFRKFREQGVEIPYPQRDVHIKDLPGGISLTAAVAEAMSEGADVINISASHPGTSTAEEAMIALAIQRGVVVVASGGNCGNWYNYLPSIAETADECPSHNALLYPAAYPGVIAVTGVDRAGKDRLRACAERRPSMASAVGLRLSTLRPASRTTIPSLICSMAACAGQRNDPGTDRESRPVPVMEAVGGDQGQPQERRDGQQDQGAAGQPAAGVGIFQDEAGDGRDRG